MHDQARKSIFVFSHWLDYVQVNTEAETIFSKNYKPLHADH